MGKREVVYTMILPWPDKSLSPNARVHWAVKSKQVKIHKQMAWIGAKTLPDKNIEGTTLKFIFTPPDKRKRDFDNMVAMCKAYIDGMCHALGMDDSQFTKTIIEKKPPKKGGCVEIYIYD